MSNFNGALSAGGVPESEHEACLAWAFGPTFGSMALISSADIWNQRHSDLFVILGSDSMIESIEKIGRAYMKHKIKELRAGI